MGALGEHVFTHVIVDDASQVGGGPAMLTWQVSEAEALYALCLGSVAILVGHPHASSPPSFSALAFKE